ncbi:MAG TPA: monooxygenase, partial [Actinoplanes sp.]
SQFLPQNADIVHHAIFFRLAPEQVTEAETADAASPGQGWTCFGNSGISGDAAWVAHWAPGSDETLLSPTIGYPMPAGSRMVMQVHYNLLGAQGKPTGSDKSGIRLRLSARSDLTPLETALVPAPVELPCAAGESGPLCDRETAIQDVTKRFGAPAGQSVAGLNERCNQGRTPTAGTVQRCDYPIPEAATVYAVAGHMHLLGRAITIELNPGRSTARTLLNVPNYNFDEQSIVPLPTPVRVTAGDQLRVTCRHDATLRQKLPQLRTQPARYVVWGEGTSDEMCLGLIIWSRTN